jgi:hypothetical protein
MCGVMINNPGSASALAHASASYPMTAAERMALPSSATTHCRPHPADQPSLREVRTGVSISSI